MRRYAWVTAVCLAAADGKRMRSSSDRVGGGTKSGECIEEYSIRCIGGQNQMIWYRMEML